MKKLANLAIATALVSTLAFVGAPAVAANAAGGTVQGDASNIMQWHQTATWEDEGLAVYAGQWAGGGFRMFFDVSAGKKFSMKFKVPVYENDSTDYVMEGDKMLSKYMCDVMVGKEGGSTYTMLRLWGDSSKEVGSNSVSAKITAGDLHADTAESRPNEVAEGVWVKGAMRADSEFYVEFDTTDAFSSYWGDWDTVGPLLTVSGSVSNGETVKQTIANMFEGAQCVQVFFRLSGQHNPEINGGWPCEDPMCPEHAAIASSKVIITEVNGQSLANNNGEIVDTVAPYLAPVKVRPNAVITQGKEYDVEIKGSPVDGAKQTIYCDYASDLLSYHRLSYKVNVTAPSGATKSFGDFDEDEIKVMFEEEGINKVSITVTDLGGNSYTTPETEIEVVHGFLLTVDGIPETGTVGTKLTLPAGTATDSKDNECPVTISVEDPYAKAYTLENGGFTPDKPGVWYITYSAQNEDGTESDTKNFRIVVTEASGGNGGTTGDNKGGKGCGGSITMMSGLGAAAIIGVGSVLIAVRKKKN